VSYDPVRGELRQLNQPRNRALVVARSLHTTAPPAASISSHVPVPVFPFFQVWFPR
jgi:hypothetical protein